MAQRIVGRFVLLVFCCFSLLCVPAKWSCSAWSWVARLGLSSGMSRSRGSQWLRPLSFSPLSSSSFLVLRDTLRSETAEPPPAATAAPIAIDTKEAVKVFGRLAEKYIALDSSGGMCCYSACADCEYRLPGGGYRMADQTAARPKWIPHYVQRQLGEKEPHITKWSQALFGTSSPTEDATSSNSNSNAVQSLTRYEFVARVAALEYNPPLGGPYVAASNSAIANGAATERLFDALMMMRQPTNAKNGNNNNNNGSSRDDNQEDTESSSQPIQKLTRQKMSVRLRQLANGEEGMTWPAFERIFRNE